MRSPRRALTEEEKAAAVKLAAFWLKKQAAEKTRTGKKLTQADAAYDMGFSTQGAFSHYIRGKIPLNVNRLLGFAAYFNVHPREISPQLASTIGLYHYELSADRQHLGMVADYTQSYTTSIDEKKLTKSLSFIFENYSPEDLERRGAQWMAQAVMKIGDLNNDPAAKNLKPETILKLLD